VHPYRDGSGKRQQVCTAVGNHWSVARRFQSDGACKTLIAGNVYNGLRVTGGID